MRWKLEDLYDFINKYEGAVYVDDDGVYWIFEGVFVDSEDHWWKLGAVNGGSYELASCEDTLESYGLRRVDDFDFATGKSKSSYSSVIDNHKKPFLRIAK